MADIVDLPGETLETRYATQHVGGAFDAKHPPKPRALEKILEDKLWSKYTGSLFIIGLDTRPYSNNPQIRPSHIEPVGSGAPGRYVQPPFIPPPEPGFGPLIPAPTFIYWDTDPDQWNYSGSHPVGQVFWDYV